MQVTMERDALIQKLQEQLKVAEAEDAKKEKAHKAEEQAALMAFRAKLREALKWDYAKAKKCESYGSNSLTIKAPSCPRREAPAISAALYMVQISSTKKFTVKSDTDLHRALAWVPASERVGHTVCD